jgi:hypothetical protein
MLTVSKAVMVEKIVTVTLREIHDFTKSDWMGYAGCEDRFGIPQIFVVEFEESVAVFVADDNGISSSLWMDRSKQERRIIA